MNKQESNTKSQPREGMGSDSATRRYLQHLASAIASGDLEAIAEEAGQAISGPEGEELERAAEQAKKGPKHTGAKDKTAAHR